MIHDMHAIVPSLPALEDIDARRLVLRDGSVAILRVTRHDDCDAMRQLVQTLWSEPLRELGDAANAMVDRFCDSTNPARGLTLVAERRANDSDNDDVRFIAVASYVALTAGVADVTCAVDDRWQGNGLPTALLERLAVLAAAGGVQRFQAKPLADHTAMLEVVSDSGFEIVEVCRRRPRRPAVA